MANFNFNHVIVGGRISKDPELKTTQSGITVTQFSIAVNRSRKKGEEQQTDFFDVVAWRDTAEFITKFFRKGNSICIVGSLQTRSYTDKNNNKRYVTEILADKAHFVDSMQDTGNIVQHDSIENGSGALQIGAQQYYVSQSSNNTNQQQIALQGETEPSGIDANPMQSIVDDESELPF